MHIWLVPSIVAAWTFFGLVGWHMNTYVYGNVTEFESILLVIPGPITVVSTLKDVRRVRRGTFEREVAVRIDREVIGDDDGFTGYHGGLTTMSGFEFIRVARAHILADKA